MILACSKLTFNTTPEVILKVWKNTIYINVLCIFANNVSFDFRAAQLHCSRHQPGVILEFLPRRELKVATEWEVDVRR